MELDDKRDNEWWCVTAERWESEECSCVVLGWCHYQSVAATCLGSSLKSN